MKTFLEMLAIFAAIVIVWVVVLLINNVIITKVLPYLNG